MAIQFLNTVAVDTNVLYVDTSSDRVGIGTTSPDVALDVDALTGIKVQYGGEVVFEANANNGTFSLGDTGGVGGTAYITSDSTDIDFFGDGDVRFQNNDNVGIGTTSPSQKLDVNGNVTANRYYGTGSTTYYVDPNDTSQAAYFAGDIRITDSGTATIKLDSTSMLPGASIFATKNGSTSPPMGEISWVENISFQGSTWAQRLSSVPYTESSIKLPTSSSYNFAIKTLGSDRMVINSSGNVGIGTTSPVAKLDVNGGIRLGQYNAIQWGGNTSNQLSINDSSSNGAGLKGYINLTSVNTFGAAFNMNFGVGNNATDRMVITYDGNVGIGTTSPSQKLDVVGNIRSQFNSGDYSQLESNGSGGVIKAVSSTSTTVLFRSYGDSYILNDLGIGTTNPASKLQVNGAVQVADDTATASVNKVGALRYRTSGNNSYVDMCMQTGSSTYAWVNIVTNSW